MIASRRGCDNSGGIGSKTGCARYPFRTRAGNSAGGTSGRDAVCRSVERTSRSLGEEAVWFVHLFFCPLETATGCKAFRWHRPRFPAAQTPVLGLSELKKRIRQDA
jgi:hypothetical protein